MPTRALSGARMVRDLGVTREFLASNVAQTQKIQQFDADRFLGRDIRNSGTGDSSQVQPWYDVQVPDWTTGAHVRDWSTLQYYLSSVAQTNSLVPNSAVYLEYSNSGLFGTGANGQFHGGVLHPNGKIYLTPYQATYSISIDPQTNQLSSIGPLTYSNPIWEGSVLAGNGKIYCVPHTATSCLVIDPIANSIAYIGNAATFSPGAGVWFSQGCLGPNGKVYFAPHNSTWFVKIDPDTNTIFSHAAMVGNQKYLGMVSAPNGRLYLMPFISTVGAYIDPNTDTFVTYTTNFPGSNGAIAAFASGVLAPNGKIYMIPGHATVGVVLDPSNNTASVYATSFPGTNGSITGYGCGCLGSDGKIYCSPLESTLVTVIDPSNDTVVTLATVSTGSKWIGAISTPNGKIVFLPYIANSVLSLHKLNNNNWNTNICTNPMFNRT
jgi:streptogramin lyase